jgi:hypothetical protein
MTRASQFFSCAFVFNGLRWPGVLVRVAWASQHRALNFNRGVIVQIGFGSYQIGLECKERRRARFAGLGHVAVDFCTGDFCRSDYRRVTDALASTSTRTGSNVVC